MHERSKWIEQSNVINGLNPTNRYAVPMEREHAATGRFGVNAASKAGLNAGRLVQERQRATAD
jgi:hypothetical protein